MITKAEWTEEISSETQLPAEKERGRAMAVSAVLWAAAGFAVSGMRIGVKKAGQTVADSVVETTRYIVTVDSGKNKAKNVKLVGERRFMTADVGAAEILFKISCFVNVVISP